MFVPARLNAFIFIAGSALTCFVRPDAADGAIRHLLMNIINSAEEVITTKVDGFGNVLRAG